MRQAFQVYLSPEQAKAVAGAKLDGPKVELDIGDIVLVMVRDDDLSLVPSLLSKVTDCALQNGFCIEAIMASLVLISTYSNEKNTIEARRFELVDRLRQRLAGDAKVSHGRRERLRGILGSEGRSTWGSCLPNFGESLSALGRANFGEVIELK
ncbi:MAG: hypothetical protein ACHQPH_08175 [Reyranellales bacterium]